MTEQYEPIELEDGTVLQSGIATPLEDMAPPPYENTYGYIARGVVTKVYFTDDDGWAEKQWENPRGVFVDVRVFGKRQRPLFRVPVCQGRGSLWDEDTYIPRGAALNIGGGPLVTDSSPGGTKPTEAHLMDGDHVLIGFLESDPLQPFVFPFALPHPGMRQAYNEADGRVRRIRHNGTLLVWDKDGNVSIDATGAAAAGLDSSGNELSNSGTGGEVLLVTSDGSNKTSLHLNAQGQILLGSDPSSAADEPLVCGNLWISIMEELIDEIINIQVGTGTGPSSTPINFLQFQSIKAKITTRRSSSAISSSRGKPTDGAGCQ